MKAITKALWDKADQIRIEIYEIRPQTLAGLRAKARMINREYHDVDAIVE